MRNVDAGTVASFGEEWTTFDQSRVSPDELDAIFGQYFRIFPWEQLPDNAVGVDVGCGSGRWAARVAPRVAMLHCVDASEEALAAAREHLESQENCCFHHASLAEMPLAEGSMDFGYSIGVLHHVPDMAGALKSCVRTLKPGAPFLVYVYYAMENRPWWFRQLWRVSDLVRRRVVRLPTRWRSLFGNLVGIFVYWPLARTARVFERRGHDVEAFPLAYYRNRSVFTMRTDARDRFGTPLEQRVSLDELRALMQSAGLEDVVFSREPPHWTAVGRRGAGQHPDTGMEAFLG